MGDALYGGSVPGWSPRIFLHAARLVLAEELLAELPLPEARPARSASRSTTGPWPGGSRGGSELSELVSCA